MLGTALAAWQPSPPSPPGLAAILVDSTGAKMGPYDWNAAVTNIGPTVLLNINGLWLAVGADGNGFTNHGGNLYYATSDCRGTAYYAEFLGRPVVGSSFAAAGILHY